MNSQVDEHCPTIKEEGNEKVQHTEKDLPYNALVYSCSRTGW